MIGRAVAATLSLMTAASIGAVAALGAENSAPDGSVIPSEPAQATPDLEGMPPGSAPWPNAGEAVPPEDGTAPSEGEDGAEATAEEVPGEAATDLTRSKDRAVKLDLLFQRLAESDPQEAQRIQNEIFGIWNQSGSDTADYLLIRAHRAVEASDYDTALVHLDDLVRIAPEFAEAWNLRATVHFLRDDYGPALADIRRTLILEPRHFGAMAGLGIILDRIGQKKQALAAFRMALEINPHLEGATAGIKELEVNVEGKDI